MQELQQQETWVRETHYYKFIILASCFIISAANQYIALGLGLIGAVYFFTLGDIEGLLIAFSLYVLRVSSMHHYLFATIAYAPIKYAIMLLYALFLILASPVYEERQRALFITKMVLLVYSLYISISALFVSSYPTVSLVKLLLFSVAFYSVIKAVAATPQIRWENYYANLFTLINLSCLITVPLMSLRTRNGHAFQGIFDHPNIYGIFGSIVTCFILGQSNRGKVYKAVMISITIFMQYLSGSRTGLFSSVIIILVCYIFTYRNNSGKIIIYSMAIIAALYCAYLYIPGMSSAISRFFWKGYEGELLYSRSGQIDRFLDKYLYSPIFGTGFMTPFRPNVHSYNLAFDLFVEEGNLFFAVIGETGLVGLLFFVILYSVIYVLGDKDKTHFFITPFVVSFGEMIFFSTNSVGMFLYILFSIYLFGEESHTEAY